MLFLVQGSVFLKGPIPLFPSVSEFGKLLLRSRFHVVYVAWTQVMVVYDPESQSSTTILLSWLDVRTCVRYLEHCNHIVPNQLYIGGEIVGRVSSNHLRPTDN